MRRSKSFGVHSESMDRTKIALRRSVVREEEFTILLAIMVHYRKAETKQTVDRCCDDLTDVLVALRTAGHCIVPCGAVDALKRQLLNYGSKPGVQPTI
jgi:hypothetical protein